MNGGDVFPAQGTAFLHQVRRIAAELRAVQEIGRSKARNGRRSLPSDPDWSPTFI